MRVIRTIDEMRRVRPELGLLGLVPTMGALHAGHVSLVDVMRERVARDGGRLDATAVSIFVNPTQFAPHEDFHKYPRPLEDDLAMCAGAGVDVVFAPGVEEMYRPGEVRVSMDPGMLARRWEGELRPGHFAGVCQVVAKLFNIVTPRWACFGEKDFQQLAVLRAMTRSLDFGIGLVAGPTRRDADGLAMSSRNRYLSPAQRARALAIPRAIRATQQAYADGEKRVHVLERGLREALLQDETSDEVDVELQYAVIVDPATLEPLAGGEGVELRTLADESRILVAMKVGTTRLIDNAALRQPTRPSSLTPRPLAPSP